MDETNVKLGQIRTEDRIDEAKITQPIPPNRVRCCHCHEMENNDVKSESEDLLPVQGARKVYRND